MLSEKLVDLINNQVNKEFYSAYLYLDMANFYKDNNLDGFANWFNIQAQEERDHAIGFIEFLQANGAKIVLDAIDKPDKVFNDFEEPLHAVEEHEQYVTALINKIYEAAYDEKDFKSMQFLDWYVKEQMEEEDNASSLIKKFQLFGTDAKGLYMLDSELGARSYTIASILSAAKA